VQANILKLDYAVYTSVHFPTGQHVNILMTFIILQLESYRGVSLNTTCFIQNISCLVKEIV